MTKLIARQVPPENQIWEWYNEDPDSVIIFGNEELPSYTYNESVLESVEFAYDYFAYKRSGYEFDEDVYTFCEAYGLCIYDVENIFEENADNWEDAACQLLNKIEGGNWKYRMITGSVQREWNILFYDATFYDESDIKRFEGVYFGLGSEWDLYYEDDENEITSVYCAGIDGNIILREISKMTGEPIENIVLKEISENA